MGQLLLDTDVMVDYLRGNPAAVAFLKRHADDAVLASITVAELYAGVREGEEREILEAVISLFPIVAITHEVAKEAGLLKRDFGKSHAVGLADAIIAAVVRVEKVELATLNVKHYPMIAGLKPAYTKVPA